VGLNTTRAGKLVNVPCMGVAKRTFILQIHVS